MYNLFCGIDPGSTGAITIINSDGKILKSVKMPDTLQDAWNVLEEFREEIGKGKMYATTENVWAMQGNGVSGAFTFGYNVCIADSIPLYNKVPYDRIISSKWMKFFGMTRNPSQESETTWKTRLYCKCQQLFPGEKFYKYQADSILIAEYTRRTKLNIS
jgi:hypothetical protein